MKPQAKICLGASLVALFLLILFTNLAEPEFVAIKDIDNSLLDKKVQFLGKIVSISDYEGFKIMTIQNDSKTIKVVFNSEKFINNTKEQALVVGKVIEYEDKLEIEADKIVLTSLS